MRFPFGVKSLKTLNPKDGELILIRIAPGSISSIKHPYAFYSFF